MPILVATRAEAIPPPVGEVIDRVAPVSLTNAEAFATALIQAINTYGAPQPELIDPIRWDLAAYEPTPTIVEAARALYDGQNVREISRCHAGEQNLTNTSAAVMVAIERAREEKRKLICFVTGVPGSGKHSPDSTSFTTGN